MWVSPDTLESTKVSWRRCRLGLWGQQGSNKVCRRTLPSDAWRRLKIQDSKGLSSVQFSCLVVSDSLWLQESQHASLPCPSPTPGVYSNSCPSSRWCHPAISSSVVPFSSFPQSLPASRSFPMSQLFAWGGQSIRVSPSVTSKDSRLPIH